MSKRSNFLIFSVLTMGLLAANFAAAAPQYAPPTGTAIDLQDILNVITSVVNFLIIIGGIIMVIVIVWSGILWMTAGEDQTKVDKAKGTFKSGIIGALIFLGVYVILNTILGLVRGSFWSGF